MLLLIQLLPYLINLLSRLRPVNDFARFLLQLGRTHQAITPLLTPFSRQILKISFIMTVTIVSSGPAWPLPPGLPVSELGHFFLGGFEKS